jgi:outer membrane lipoprotein-sorting protein
MNFFSKGKVIFLLLTAFVLAGCQGQTTTTVNGNQTVISNVPGGGNVNIVANTNGNTNLTTGEGIGIEAREPEKYQASVTLKVETGGEKGASMAPLTAQVAKSGVNKRMEFALPNNEKIVYLERDGRQFVIAPQRQQYAELNKEALGIDPRPLLTPEQIIKQIKNIRGVQRAGEEKVGDRDAIKYTYKATTQTTSQAGEVATDAVVLVDKETGLPLRTETFVESQNASPSGIKSGRIVTEMSNLQMNVDESLFNEPTDFKKVPPEQIRSQIDLIARMAGAFLEQMMRNQGANNPAASPTATP